MEPVGVAIPPPTEVVATIKRLELAALGRFYSVNRVVVFMPILAGGTAFMTGILTNDLKIAITSGFVVLAAGFSWVGTSYFHRPFRRALEAYNDNRNSENTEWLDKAGSNFPNSPEKAERWLAEHPTGKGRAAVALAAGRVPEFDEAIDRIVPDSPEAAFGVEAMRQYRNLVAGQKPDTTRMRMMWREIFDADQRSIAREYLGVLEAQIAVARGEDPIAPLAQAHAEIEGVDPRFRPARYLGVPLFEGILLIGLGVGLAFGFS